jgi:hypothetical protein
VSRSRKQHGKRTARAVYSPPPEYRRDGSGRVAPRLLTAVADALNACDKAGILVQLAHGAAITNEGYVLAVGDGNVPMMGNRWVARTRALTPFSDQADDDD